MTRKLLAVVSAVPLVLCVATIVLWGLTYLRLVGMRYSSHSRDGLSHVRLSSVALRGGFAVMYEHHSDATSYSKYRLGAYDQPPVWSEPVEQVDAVGVPGTPRLSYLSGVFGSAYLINAASPDVLGFHFDWRVYERQSSYSRSSHAAVPFWFPVASLSMLTVWTWRRWKRREPNQCQKCGYDLRATPNRCPECGHIPNWAKATG